MNTCDQTSPTGDETNFESYRPNPEISSYTYTNNKWRLFLHCLTFQNPVFISCQKTRPCTYVLTCVCSFFLSVYNCYLKTALHTRYVRTIQACTWQALPGCFLTSFLPSWSKQEASKVPTSTLPLAVCLE